MATIDLLRIESYAAASVDAICAQSGVKKGSFYHFFKSKDELVITALEHEWQSRRPNLDRLFSPAEPPLRRLARYFRDIHERQLEMRAKYGFIVGCFFCNPPEENGVVLVRRNAKASPLKYDSDTINIEGTLHLTGPDTKDEEAQQFLFTIDDASVAKK